MKERDLPALSAEKEQKLRELFAEENPDFGIFYERTKGLVYQCLNTRMTDVHEIEDIVQQTYLLALEQWEMLKVHPNPCGWLLLTARHLYRGLHRHIYHRLERLGERVEIPYEDPAFNQVVMEDYLQRLYRPGEETLVRRYFLEGASEAQIAKELGVSLGCIRTRLYRFRKRLRKDAEEEQ